LKKSELKKIILEALTPDEAIKVDSKYKDIYSGMLRDNPLKLKKYDNPDAVAYGRAIKLVQKESKLAKEFSLDERLTSIVKEVYSEKQRKWACAQDDPKFDEMCKDTAISKKKTMENTRLQELIKSALKEPVTEETINEADYNSFLNDISTKMSELEKKDYKPFLETIKKFVENKLKTLNEDKDFIQKAIKRPGALRKKLGVKKGEDIPKGKINKAIAKLKKKDKDPEKEGTQLGAADERELRQLNLAKTLSKLKEENLSERILKELRG
jgi:hypothetical protein